MLISLILVNISQCIGILEHHNVYLKSRQLVFCQLHLNKLEKNMNDKVDCIRDMF